MAKAVKAPIRTQTEASREVYDGAEGGTVRDEAWFNAKPEKGNIVMQKLPPAKQPRKLCA